MAAVALAFVPVVGLGATVIRLKLRRLWFALQEELGVLTRVMEENLGGIRVVRAFASQAFEMTRFDIISNRALALLHRRISVFVTGTTSMTFAYFLTMVLVLWVGGILPGLPGAPDETFFAVQGLAFGAVGASMAAYMAAQFTDVRLFHFWKRLTGGRALWLRNNGSTLVSQLVDTTAVVLISHYAAHVLPVRADLPVAPQLLSFIASGYLFKALAALLDTLPFYWLTAWLRRWLKVPGAGAELVPEQRPLR